MFFSIQFLFFGGQLGPPNQETKLDFLGMSSFMGTHGGRIFLCFLTDAQSYLQWRFEKSMSLLCFLITYIYILHAEKRNTLLTVEAFLLVFNLRRIPGEAVQLIHLPIDRPPIYQRTNQIPLSQPNMSRHPTQLDL